MRFTSSQTSFKAGRLSPKLNNRIDTKQYGEGCSRLEGFKVLPEGGIERLKGTRVLSIDNTIVTPSFGTGPKEMKQFSILLGTTPILLQIYEAFPTGLNIGGLVTLYAYKVTKYGLISAGNTMLVAAGSTRYEANLFDYAFINNTLIITHFSGTFAPIYIDLSATTIDLSSAPITSMRVNRAAGQQDTLNTSLSTKSLMPIIPRYPMSDVGATGTSLTIALVAGTTIRLTGSTTDIAKIKLNGWVYLEAIGANAFGGASTYNFVISGHHWVSSIVSTTQVDVQCPFNIAAQNPLLWAGVTSVSQWAYSLWGPSDWPRTVAVHEGRVVFGGTNSQPLALFGSKLSGLDYFNQLRLPATGTPYLTISGQPMGDTIVSDPFLFTISSDNDSRINFIKSMGSLIIGTDRKEWIATGGDSILSALAVSFKPQSTQGSTPLSAISAGEGIYYLSNNGKRLFNFKYNESNGSLMSTETGLLLTDILEEDPIVSMCWAPHIQSLLLILKSYRVMGIMQVSDKEMAVYDTQLDSIESLCFIGTGIADATYPRGDMVIMYSGTYGALGWEQDYYEYGLSASYITKIGDTTKNGYLFLENVVRITKVDAAPDYFSYINTSEPAYAIGINGTNCFLVNKAFFPDGEMVLINYATKETIAYTATVEVTISSVVYWEITDATILTCNDILVGKVMTQALVATMAIEAGQQWGSAQMGIKNIDTLGIRHYKTYSYEISADGVNWQEVVVSDDAGQCTNARADRKFTTGPRTDQIVYLRNAKAEPCTIVGINMRGVSNDG